MISYSSRIARQYVFAIIQGRTVEECFQEEQMKLANDVSNKVSGYISANAYQQIRARQAATSTFPSQIKENTCNSMTSKQEQPKSSTKNVLQDKLVNIDSNSNSSSGMSSIDKASLGLFKSNSMPSFEEAAKMRARRQISFDNEDFPKRWNYKFQTSKWFSQSFSHFFITLESYNMIIIRFWKSCSKALILLYLLWHYFSYFLKFNYLTTFLCDEVSTDLLTSVERDSCYVRL